MTALPLPLSTAAGTTPLRDEAGWAGRLREHTDPGWRPTEWQQQFWLFTGNPDEPRTSVSLCRTAVCRTLVSPTNNYCPLCKRAAKQSPLPDEEFAATFVPVRTKVYFGGIKDTCSVARGGQRCVRPSHCRGLCSLHYAQFNAHTLRGKVGDWHALAVPYIDIPECPVPACPLPSVYGSGLCRHHAHLFREHRRTAPGTALADWAPRQTPYLASHQFSLLALPELPRLEVLFGLQQADPWLRIFEPCQVRRMVRDLSGTATLVSDVSDEQMCPRSTVPVRRMLGRVRTAVRAGLAQYAGTGPAEEDLLDLRALGQRSRTPVGIRHPKTVDLRTIGQPWLRRLLRTWTIQHRPNADHFARTLWGVQLASQALASRPGTDDPAKLRYDDVTAVVEAFRSALKQNGDPAGWSYRTSIAGHFFALIDYGHRSGAADEVSPAFARDRVAHRIAQEEAGEDEIGKAILEAVIRQLDAHLHLLGQGRARGRRTLASDDLQLMYQTLYVLLRDTGRRPNEIVSLPWECLETRQDQTSLIWDNHKARRHRRRLPITASTARAIRTWRQRRDQLQTTLPPAGADYLFPALTPLASSRHLHTSYLSETLRHWVSDLPELHAEGTDSDGALLPFDRSLVYAYAFRHSDKSTKDHCVSDALSC